MKALAYALLLLASPASAHSWYSSWCCRGGPNGGDCAPIPLRSVELRPDGYLVTLQRGDHPLAGAGIQTFLPLGDRGILPSQDLEFHACIVGGKVRCLYVAFTG